MRRLSVTFNMHCDSNVSIKIQYAVAIRSYRFLKNTRCGRQRSYTCSKLLRYINSTEELGPSLGAETNTLPGSVGISEVILTNQTFLLVAIVAVILSE